MHPRARNGPQVTNLVREGVGAARCRGKTGDVLGTNDTFKWLAGSDPQTIASMWLDSGVPSWLRHAMVGKSWRAMEELLGCLLSDCECGNEDVEG